tara:strand:- start:699 stop:1454 length:756 start_codon:yes stop_codon:yes gene_type:complete
MNLLHNDIPIHIEQHLEQHFRNKIKFLRCDIEIEGLEDQRFNITHIKIKRKDIKDITGQGLGETKKEAIRNAMRNLWFTLDNIPDPCTKTIKFMNLYDLIMGGKEIISFKKPPENWFSQGQILGIDWEGCPPKIVQISCEHGIYIDRVESQFVKKILESDKHTHCVFGKHEIDLVENPLNLQQNPELSLAEYLSREFFPKIRIKKDKKIHLIVDWGNIGELPYYAIKYAALDAEVTRILGHKNFKKLCNSE